MMPCPHQAPHFAAGWAEEEGAGRTLARKPRPARGRSMAPGSPTSVTPDQPEEQTEHAFINVLTRGDLSSIRWVCSPLRHAQHPGPGLQLCTVYYASLNFRDIMLATGKLSPDAIPGTGITQLAAGGR